METGGTFENLPDDFILYVPVGAVQTYENALARGDKNVWFIPGTELIRDEIADDWSVDGIHPTDLGFFSMADAIAPTLEKMIKLVKEK